MKQYARGTLHYITIKYTNSKFSQHEHDDISCGIVQTAGNNYKKVSLEFWEKTAVEVKDYDKTISNLTS